MNLVCAFDLIPGLVIDLVGIPAIVTNNERDSDTEIATVTLNTGESVHQLEISWARPPHIPVIGVTVNLDPENIVLFDS